MSVRLNDRASILQADLDAIDEALQQAKNGQYDTVVVVTDSTICDYLYVDYAVHYLIDCPANIIQREKLVTGSMCHIMDSRNKITAILNHQARTGHRILTELIKKYPIFQ